MNKIGSVYNILPKVCNMLVTDGLKAITKSVLPKVCPIYYILFLKQNNYFILLRIKKKNQIPEWESFF